MFPFGHGQLQVAKFCLGGDRGLRGGISGIATVGGLFECLVERSTRCYKKLLSSARADSENNLGGSSQTICITSDWTFTRRRSAIA